MCPLRVFLYLVIIFFYTTESNLQRCSGLSPSNSLDNKVSALKFNPQDLSVHLYQRQQLSPSQADQQTKAAQLDSSSTNVLHPQGTMLAMPPNNPISTNYLQQSSKLSNGASLADESILVQQKNVQKLQSKQANPTVDFHQTGGYVNHHGTNMELALRQASGDENMFQPSPAFGMLDHDFDWLARINQQPSNQAALKVFNSDNKGEVHQQQDTIAPLMVEQSNSISPVDRVQVNKLQQPQNEPAYPSSVDGIGVSSQQQVSSTANPVVNQSIVTTSTMDLPNNVVYEGPATAPPSPGDYYYSPSEKLPNQEKVSNAWWALGIGAEFERASNLTRNDYLDYCGHSELLVSNKQRSLCRMHPRIMPVIARGIRLAIDECQSRFTTSRWNCSLVLQDSLEPWRDGAGSGVGHGYRQQHQVFGEVMSKPNRERALLNGLVAAGLAHAMTKACSQGELPEECSCDKRIKSKNNKGKIEWVACSDDIDYGARFSRDFTDNTDFDSDTVSMINTHNYEVGRRIFKSATDITCTCQNQTPDQVADSLCQSKRCWKHLGPFADIGDELIRRYESATHVQLSSRDPHKLRPVRRGVRKPKRKDLVYIDESPDYCTADTRLGILGTRNRRCNSTSIGSHDSCSLLCCGRGYQVVVEEVEEDCNCKFVWCCHLDCEKCKRQITNDVCN